MNEVTCSMMGDEYCCGIIQMGHFNEKYQSFLSKEKVPKWDSAKWEEGMIETVVDHVDGNNTYPGGGYLLQCTLVSRYGEAYNQGQLPEFQKYLLASGWENVIKFKNANTGNMVKVYYRFLPDEEINTYLDYFNKEDDAYDD